MFEKILKWYNLAYGLKYISLRYFNVAGGSLNGKTGQRSYSANTLIPTIIKAIEKKSRIEVFGTNYPTRDGTCIRDFVHVIDVIRKLILCQVVYILANAHILSIAGVYVTRSQNRPDGGDLSNGRSIYRAQPDSNRQTQP